jgi:serine/threonine protein kinase
MIVTNSSGEMDVKLLDFGLAKLTNTYAQTPSTLSGFVVGTPNYLSPECCLGEKYDVRSEIYALGLLMYETLTGTRANQADNADTAMQNALSESPKPFAKVLPEASIPDALENVVFKAISKNPNARYQKVDDAAKDLQEIRNSFIDGRTMPSIAVPERLASPGLLKRVGKIPVIVVLVLMAAGLTPFFLWHRQPVNQLMAEYTPIDRLVQLGCDEVKIGNKADGRAHLKEAARLIQGKDLFSERIAIMLDDAAEVSAIGANDFETAEILMKAKVSIDRKLRGADSEAELHDWLRLIELVSRADEPSLGLEERSRKAHHYLHQSTHIVQSRPITNSLALAQYYEHLGKVHMLDGQDKEAETCILQALEGPCAGLRDGKDVGSREVYDRLVVGLADALTKQKKYEEAEKVLSAALENQADIMPISRRLVRVCMSEGKYGDANGTLASALLEIKDPGEGDRLAFERGLITLCDFAGLQDDIFKHTHRPEDHTASITIARRAARVALSKPGSTPRGYLIWLAELVKDDDPDLSQRCLTRAKSNLGTSDQ